MDPWLRLSIFSSFSFDSLSRINLNSKLDYNSSYRTSNLRVRFYMFRQMVRPHEFFSTLRTLESLLTGVGSTMPLKFVRPSEFLTTKYPTTNERSFSSVPPQMSPKMARLPVYFITACYVANMLPFPSHVSVPIHV